MVKSNGRFIAEPSHTHRGGMKYDQDKLQFSLIDPFFLEELAKLLQIGAKKYSPNNWKEIDKERYINALMRHLNDYRKGAKVDPETGIRIPTVIACNAMFLDYFDRDELMSS